MAPKEEIKGISLLDPSKLPAKFRRFKNDDLYFISTVQYHRQDQEPVPRCVALTPVAFFVTDTSGQMDRATRCEMISEMRWQSTTVKKFIGSEEQVQAVVKVPKEFDAHFSFVKDGSESATQHAKKFVDTMKILCSHRQKRDFPAIEVPKDQPFLDNVKKEAPKGYMSPQEIIKANQERKQMQEQVEVTNAEIVKLQDQLEVLRKSTSERGALLKQLEASVGVDLSELRSRKAALSEETSQLHKKVTTMEIDQVKLKADLARRNEELEEQRENKSALLQEKLQDADSAQVKQQNEMMLLRQKAQKREIDKAMVKYDNLKVKLGVPIAYDGPENLVNRSKEMDTKVQAAMERWERDLDGANKVEKFIDTLNAEIERLSRQALKLHDEKTEMIDARQPKEAPKPAAAASPTHADPTADLLDSPKKPAPAADLDDDLLGDLPPKPAAAAPPANAGADMDDLLGDTPPAAAKPAPKPSVDLDDDLLGGSAPAPAPAAPPADAGSPDLL